MFGFLSKRKPVLHVCNQVAATKATNEKHPARKCPFMYPLVYRDHNGFPIHNLYDCIRQECQIWDGVNCSLHHVRKS